MSYKLEIPWKQYQQLQVYTDNVNTEIGGFGRVQLDKKTKVFTIAEIFLVEQETSSTECGWGSLSPDKLINQLVEEGTEEELKLYWHSHGTMDSFFSGLDMKAMDEWPGDWIISIVLNKKRKIVGRLQTLLPVSMYVDLDVEILYPEAENIEELKAEIKSKVKPKYTPPTFKSQYQWTPEKKWEKEKLDSTPLHRMTAPDYEEMMMAEYDVYDNDEKKWEDWSEKYLLAANNLDVNEQMNLLEEAVREDILTLEEVQSYLETGEELDYAA